MDMVVVCLLITFITSVITTKVLATYYFKIVDDYVQEMVDMTMQYLEALRQELEASDRR